MHIIALFFALLSFADAGGAMDPNGCPSAHAGACNAAGIRIDPNGQPHATATASSDQGSMIDPDGRPAR